MSPRPTARELIERQKQELAERLTKEVDKLKVRLIKIGELIATKEAQIKKLDAAILKLNEEMAAIQSQIDELLAEQADVVPAGA